jgi:hypothetical protein
MIREFFIFITSVGRTWLWRQGVVFVVGDLIIHEVLSGRVINPNLVNLEEIF